LILPEWKLYNHSQLPVNAKVKYNGDLHIAYVDINNKGLYVCYGTHLIHGKPILSGASLIILSEFSEYNKFL